MTCLLTFTAAHKKPDCKFQTVILSRSKREPVSYSPIMIVLQHFQHVSPNILHCPLTHMPSKANMPVFKGSVPLKKLFCSNALSWSRNGARHVSSTLFGQKSAQKQYFGGKWLRDPTTGAHGGSIINCYVCPTWWGRAPLVVGSLKYFTQNINNLGTFLPPQNQAISKESDTPNL